MALVSDSCCALPTVEQEERRLGAALAEEKGLRGTEAIWVGLANWFWEDKRHTSIFVDDDEQC